MDKEGKKAEIEAAPENAPPKEASRGSYDSRTASWIVVIITAVIIFFVLSSMLRLRGKTRSVRTAPGGSAPQKSAFDYRHKTRVNTRVNFA